MIWLKYLFIAVVCYFLGNISTGVLVGKLLAKTDIRQYGSGNAGTTNVMRTLGWVPSLMTLAGDVVKAALSVVIGRAIAGEIGWIVGAIAVLLGHNWPVLFGFKGGKGMACSLGIILATEPPFALTVLLVQVLVLVLTGYMSVASLTTAVLYPVLVICFHAQDVPYVIFSLVGACLAIFCHRSNIDRLIHHRENRLDFSKIKTFNRKFIHRK